MLEIHLELVERVFGFLSVELNDWLLCGTLTIWRIPKYGHPKWMIYSLTRKNPPKMDDLGCPYFRKPPNGQKS